MAVSGWPWASNSRIWPVIDQQCPLLVGLCPAVPVQLWIRTCTGLFNLCDLLDALDLIHEFHLCHPSDVLELLD